MTPERKAYLAKCSEREKFLRKRIADWKLAILHFKYAIYKELDLSNSRQHLRLAKYEYTAYRHELARLKGMDRVAVPKGTKCKCGYWLYIDWEYCPNCGRRALWERVRK